MSGGGLRTRILLVSPLTFAFPVFPGTDLALADMDWIPPGLLSLCAAFINGLLKRTREKYSRVGFHKT